MEYSSVHSPLQVRFFLAKTKYQGQLRTISMEPTSPSCAISWKSIALICGLVMAAIGGVRWMILGIPVLESDPAIVRPWANSRFLELTKPVPSTGTPLDPQYLAHCSPPGPVKNPGWSVALTIDSAHSEYVPNYEVLEFGAASGFTGTHGCGTLRWIAAKAYAPNPDNDRDPPHLDFFHPDGKTNPPAGRRVFGHQYGRAAPFTGELDRRHDQPSRLS